MAFVKAIVDFLSYLNHFLKIVRFVRLRDFVLYIVFQSLVVSVAYSLLSLIGERGMLLELSSIYYS